MGNIQLAELALQKLVLLGDQRLYQECKTVKKAEMPLFEKWKTVMHEVMEAVRFKYGFGRAIAAPQVGIMKRMIYLNLDTPQLIINPQIESVSQEMIELWDDCMSFPNLLVRVKRHKSLRLRFLTQDWKVETWEIEDDLSELIQHECDHLDGILCTMRAINERSFKWRPL